MKTNKTMGILAMSATLLASQAAFAAAANGVDTHGGDGVKLSNDTIVLADPFLVRDKGPVNETGTPFAPHPAIFAEISRAIRLMGRYDGSDTSLEQRFLDPGARYFFVDKLTDPKCKNGASYDIPVGSTFAGNIACTDGKKTWIVRDAFKKMTVREQAKLLIHERLRALPVYAGLPLIADITTGAEVLLSLYNSQLGGGRPELSSAQIERINAMRGAMALLQLGRSDAEGESEEMANNRVSPHGGALVHKDAKVSSSAYVGVGTVVDQASVIASGVQVVNVLVSPTFDLREGARVINSEIDAEKLVLAPGCEVRNSKIESRNPWADYSNEEPIIKASSRPGTVTLFQGTKILNSTIKAGHVFLSDGAKITDSTLYNREGIIGLFPGASIENMKLGEEYKKGFSLALNRNAALKNGELKLAGSFGYIWASTYFPPSVVGYQQYQSRPFGNVSSFEALILRENVSIDLQHRQICPVAGNVLRRGNTKVDGIDDLVSRCAKR